MKRQFVIQELRTLAEYLITMADDMNAEMERLEGRRREGEAELLKPPKKKHPVAQMPAQGLPSPPGGSANWEFVKRKFDNLYESTVPYGARYGDISDLRPFLK